MAKPNHQVIIDFIISCLRKGDARAEILAKTVNSWQMSNRAFDRMLKTARENLTIEQEAIKKELATATTQNALDGLRRDLMQVDERREILTKIARGEIELSKPMVCDKEIVLVPVIPDWKERREAIAELNKMGGDYAPIRKDIKINKVGLEALNDVYV